MKPELKKIWVKALRSGEYKQTKSKLCKDGGFCCLGVAYDVLSDGDWSQDGNRKTMWGIKDESLDSNQIDYNMPSPKTLREWGLSRRNAGILAELNDAGCTFEEIAARIEKDDL